jgi:TolA-binding protein
VGLFGKRQASPAVDAMRVATLETELRNLQSEFRQLQGEQTLMHDQVRKWMRRAVAAERNQERAGAAPAAPPASALPPEAFRGARGRRLARRLGLLNGHGAAPASEDAPGSELDTSPEVGG